MDPMLCWLARRPSWALCNVKERADTRVGLAVVVRKGAFIIALQLGDAIIDA